MGGFLGIGGSSAKTDRGNQLAATQGLWNVFNYGLPTGESGQATGQADLGQASSAFSKLLTAGRTDTAASSAPAVNAAINQGDAAKRQEATSGTGRTGGTAEFNREAGAKTSGTIDQIIGNNIQSGREAGAKGLQGIGGTELANAMGLLGLGSGADTSILSNATASRPVSNAFNTEAAQGYGSAIAQILTALNFQGD